MSSLKDKIDHLICFLIGVAACVAYTMLYTTFKTSKPFPVAQDSVVKFNMTDSSVTVNGNGNEALILGNGNNVYVFGKSHVIITEGVTVEKSLWKAN